MSSETLLISIISGLLVIIQGLVGWIFTSTVKDLRERIDRQDCRFEKYVKDKGDFDYKFRHDEYAKRNVEVEVRLSHLERFPQRIEQLWSKIFNGHSK